MPAIKMNYGVHLICISCLLITINLVNGFPKDDKCGNTHGCWGDCDGSCSFLLTWKTSSEGLGVDFTIKAKLSSTDDQWVGFGISQSPTMQDSSVTSILMTNNSNMMVPENSYNLPSGNENSVVSPSVGGLTNPVATYSDGILTASLTRSNTNSNPRVFDLTTNYYVLFAKGTILGGEKRQHFFTDKTDELVDFQSTQDLAGGVAIIKPFTSILIMLCVSQIVLFSM
ncbi:uncharacterized protein [Mytilus edulis]|uniref:uncharacterized protein n=1 Tax=Mytilus edulis TaxID=6550 RepID=UPI0039F0DF6E